MKTSPRIWIVVPAAGRGQRMGSECPKQYLPLQGRPLIEHTLERLLSLPKLSGLVVSLAPEDKYFNTLSVAQSKKATDLIIKAEGGAERSDSVLSALEVLARKLKADPLDWVLVHDAARCCVSIGSIQTLLSTIAEHPVGGILAVPASDTLKQVTPDGCIQQTIDRRHIWQAQTPQAFRFGLLKQALESAREQSSAVTDEASAVEHLGHQPLVVMGRYDNIKVTHPQDLILAETFLSQEKTEPLV